MYDAFCLPSFKEGYPNVIVEAMSCELPVLCSKICENPVIVEDNINGFLFDPHNILLYKTLYHQAAENSRARAHNSAGRIWADLPKKHLEKTAGCGMIKRKIRGGRNSP